MEWVMGWIYLELPLAGVRGVRMEMLMLEDKLVCGKERSQINNLTLYFKELE